MTVSFSHLLAQWTGYTWVRHTTTIRDYRGQPSTEVWYNAYEGGSWYRLYWSTRESVWCLWSEYYPIASCRSGELRTMLRERLPRGPSAPTPQTLGQSSGE